MIRIFDFILSLIAIIFLLPIFILIIPILKFTGEGEVFYYQSRIGFKGKKFYIIKFATMKKDSPNLEGGMLTIDNDPRILPLGHFLRATKINELPQIFNILLGNMSIIGPRPLTEEIISYYDQESRDIILSSKPGLSGIGSIIFRSEQEILSETDNIHKYYSEEIAPYKMELEKWYIYNKSLLLNIKLILVTINAVIFKASQLHWRIFNNLPNPPQSLKQKIGFPNGN